MQAVAPGCLAFFPDDPAGTPVTGKRRIHLLIALIAFLAVAAGTLLAGYPLRSGLSWRGWSSPLTAIPALAILDLVLPGRHGLGARPGSA